MLYAGVRLAANREDMALQGKGGVHLAAPPRARRLRCEGQAIAEALRLKKPIRGVALRVPTMAMTGSASWPGKTPLIIQYQRRIVKIFEPVRIRRSETSEHGCSSGSTAAGSAAQAQAPYRQAKRAPPAQRLRVILLCRAVDRLGLFELL